MKKIEVNGRTLEYEVHSNGCEFDTWYWTDFYEGTVTVKKKTGFLFFGKTVVETRPKRILRLHFDIESPFCTQEQVISTIEQSLNSLIK